jgi:type IV pilus assembly protein PilA
VGRERRTDRRRSGMDMKFGEAGEHRDLWHIACLRRRVTRSALRARSRGFTMAELLIVVAMIGVMAALATVGYRKYLHSAQGSEAKAVIQAIRGSEEVYKAEMLVYLGPSQTLTDYYPNKTPNDSRWSWVQPGDTRYTDSKTGWQLLNVLPDGPVRFGYALVAGIGPTPPWPSQFSKTPANWPPAVSPGQPWYVVVAANDHNNNNKFDLFTSSSFSGEIFSEDEAE